MSKTFVTRIREIEERENVDVTLHLEDGTEAFFSYAGYRFGENCFMMSLMHFEKKVYPNIIKSIEVDGEHLISF